MDNRGTVCKLYSSVHVGFVIVECDIAHGSEPVSIDHMIYTLQTDCAVSISAAWSGSKGGSHLADFNQHLLQACINWCRFVPF